MSKLLILTDLHIVAPPETIIGLDPRARLRDGPMPGISSSGLAVIARLRFARCAPIA